MDVKLTSPESSSNETREDLIERLLKTEGGRAKILVSLVDPTRLRIESLAIPIQAFRLLGDEEEIPEGWVEQMIVASCAPSIQPYSEEEIKSGSPVPGRTGGLFIRTMELLSTQLQVTISERLFQALNEWAALVSSSPFSKEGMDAVLASKIFMAARTYADARKELPLSFDLENYIDEKMRAGRFGKYRGGEIYISRMNPVDTVFGCDELGGVKVKVIPVRLEQEVPWETNLEMKVEVRVYWNPEVNPKKWAVTPELEVAR